MLYRLTLLLMILVARPFNAFAQSAGGLHGQVLDPSKAVVPGATLTLTAGAKQWPELNYSDDVSVEA
jgi:hypothetical protein